MRVKAVPVPRLPSEKTLCLSQKPALGVDALRVADAALAVAGAAAGRRVDVGEADRLPALHRGAGREHLLELVDDRELDRDRGGTADSRSPACRAPGSDRCGSGSRRRRTRSALNSSTTGSLAPSTKWLSSVVCGQELYSPSLLGELSSSSSLAGSSPARSGLARMAIALCLLTSPSAVADERLTLQVVAAERRARGVDLDALQLALEACRHRRNGARIETGAVFAEAVGRVHGATLAGHPVCRLLAGQPDREVGDLPQRAAVEACARSRRSSARAPCCCWCSRSGCTVSRRVGRVDRGPSHTTLGNTSTDPLTSVETSARVTEANAKTLTSTPQRPHTQRIPSALLITRLLSWRRQPVTRRQGQVPYTKSGCLRKWDFPRRAPTRVVRGRQRGRPGGVRPRDAKKKARGIAPPGL